MAGQIVGGLEPSDFARTEDVKARRDRVGIVERADAEIDRLGLVIDSIVNGVPQDTVTVYLTPKW